jgi:hypothetical protein
VCLAFLPLVFVVVGDGWRCVCFLSFLVFSFLFWSFLPLAALPADVHVQGVILDFLETLEELLDDIADGVAEGDAEGVRLERAAVLRMVRLRPYRVASVHCTDCVCCA